MSMPEPRRCVQELGSHKHACEGSCAPSGKRLAPWHRMSLDLALRCRGAQRVIFEGRPLWEGGPTRRRTTHDNRRQASRNNEGEVHDAERVQDLTLPNARGLIHMGLEVWCQDLQKLLNKFVALVRRVLLVCTSGSSWLGPRRRRSAAREVSCQCCVRCSRRGGICVQYECARQSKRNGSSHLWAVKPRMPLPSNCLEGSDSRYNMGPASFRGPLCLAAGYPPRSTFLMISVPTGRCVLPTSTMKTPGRTNVGWCSSSSA